MVLSDILEKIDKFKRDEVRLVAASKYVGANEIKALYERGLSEFGENQVKALASKKQDLQSLAIKWHFIGNLQSNKINLLLKQRPILWQSCNSLKLAKEVDKRLSFTLDTLLEINSANETSKSGIEPEIAVETYLQIMQECPNLRLCGVMSIGLHSSDTKEIIKSFEKTFAIYEMLQKQGANICSMGMSSDFELALKSGSNMLRLGSVLFK